jgi:hypothetical protein
MPVKIKTATDLSCLIPITGSRQTVPVRPAGAEDCKKVFVNEVFPALIHQDMLF